MHNENGVFGKIKLIRNVICLQHFYTNTTHIYKQCSYIYTYIHMPWLNITYKQNSS
jgi:hypothetical protein